MARTTRTNQPGPGRSEQRLAWLMDSSIPLPGGYRIGLDGLIGLIPGFGDLVGGGLSTWIIYQGYKQGLPRMVLMRMLINILIDTALGAIPVIGDLFDFFWKANQRNLDLMASYRHAPGQTYRRATWTSVLFIAGVLALLALFVYLMIALFALVWQSINA